MLHYERHFLSEQAEWLVFIHGAGGSIVTWKYQVEAFKPYFNLLLVDLRDHGRSKNLEPAYREYNFDIVCDDILKVIDHLGIHKAHFLSLSMGSIILQRLIERRGDLVDKLVMAGAVFRANWKMKLFVYSARFLKNILPYRVMYDLFSLIILPKKNHARSRRIFRLQSRKLNTAEYLKWVALHKEFFGLLRRFFDQKLEKASLVVVGSEDHIFFQAAKRFVARQQKATLVIFERCGHVCNIEQFERFNQIALQYLLQPKATL